MKRHWYQIKMSYIDGNKEVFFDTATVGVVCQSDILRFRQIKKSAAKNMMEKPGVVSLLCNGSIQLVVLSYLGKFDGDAPNIRDYVVERLGDWVTGYFIHAVAHRTL